MDGNKKYLTIAQASDFHICRNGLFAYKVSDSVRGLEKFVSTFNKLTFTVDLLCITGDLSDDGSISSYEIIKEKLSELSAPYYLIPGNHDTKQNMAAVFTDHKYLNNYIDNRIYHSFIVNDIKIILLDSVSIGNPNGSLTNGILKKMEQDLNSNNYSLVFLHHPPFCTGIEIMDNQQFQNENKFNIILRNTEKLMLVGCGHIHREIFMKKGNINYVISPSSAMQMVLNLTDFAPAHFNLENAGYLLHRINLNGNEPPEIITYVVPISDNEEMGITYPFYE